MSAGASRRSTSAGGGWGGHRSRGRPPPGLVPWGPSAVDLAGMALLAGWGWWRARDGAGMLPLWAATVLLGALGLLAGLGSARISAGGSGALLVFGGGFALAVRGQEQRVRRVLG